MQSAMSSLEKSNVSTLLQSPSTVFLVRTAQFGYNSETALTNRFQV
jgi:hypothetical protein